jgi:hypothetical protein
VRQQLDFLVDELFERVVVCALLDPPKKHMSCFMFNVDTGDFEQYPDGWWRQVGEVRRVRTGFSRVRVSGFRACLQLGLLCVGSGRLVETGRRGASLCRGSQGQGLQGRGFQVLGL